MVDIADDALKSFFSAGNMNDPRVNSQLRQKMALAMMVQKRAFPKNIGEGLSAIGDAIGDRSTMRQLMDADLAQQAVQPPSAAATPLAALAGSQAMAYAPEDGGGGEDYQPAPQQPVQQGAAPQPSVFESGAPPVQGLPPGTAGLPPPAQQLPPAETYTPPTPEQSSAARDALTRQLIARQRGAAGGPPPNPMLAGAVPAPISTADRMPSPEPAPGSQPDQQLALNAPQDARGAVTDIRPAPPMRVAQAAPQQQYPAGYVPPAPGAPQGAPIIPMSSREVQLSRWLAANQGNPYAAMKVGPELGALQQARTTRQNEANELFKAEIARGTTQAAERLKGQMGQADTIQKWRKGEQDLIAGQPPQGAATPGGADPRLLGTPYSPQRTGIPTPPPMPAGVSPQEWSKLQAPLLSKANEAVEKAVPQFAEALKTVQLAREHPGREWGVGAMSGIASSIPGSSAMGFSKIMAQIGGKNFLNAYQQLKGGGSITEIEGTKAEAAQARLATAQNKQDFNKALDDFESALRSDLEQVQRKTNRPVTAWRQIGDNASTAPDIGERRGRNEYVGGDPSDPASWRRVQ